MRMLNVKINTKGGGFFIAYKKVKKEHSNNKEQAGVSFFLGNFGPTKLM